MSNWVDLPAPQGYSVMYEPLEWAKRHCASYITNDAVLVQREGVYHYRFYFGQERDRLMFLLRWS